MEYSFNRLDRPPVIHGKRRTSLVSFGNASEAEEYLIEQSASVDDPNRSEAWLLTAKTLFPSSFLVQFAIYAMYRDTQRGSEAATQLGDLMNTFGSEQNLTTEMKVIARAVQDNTAIDSSRQLVAIFKQLPPSQQYDLLLNVCLNANDTPERTRFLLLLMRRFPDSVPEHGPALIEELLQNQKTSTSPTSIFRKLLIFNVLPLILPRLKLEPKLIVELLEHGIIFYAHYVDSANKYLDLPVEPKDLWALLADLTKMVDVKLNWNLSDLLEGQSLSETQLARLKGFEVGPNSSLEIVDLSRSNNLPTDESMQRFYITMVLFVRSVHFYGRYTSSSDESLGCVMVDFREPQKQLPKKKKVERPLNQLAASKQLPGDVAFSLINHFQTAVKCWNFLNCFKNDFERLSELAGLCEWKFLNEFYIDALVFQNQHEDAIRRRCNLMATHTDHFSQLKSNIHLASCFFATGDRHNALARVLEVISSLPETDPPIADRNLNGSSLYSSQTSHNSHTTLQAASTAAAVQPDLSQLCFIMCSRTEILRFCVRLVMACLKERIADQRDDLALGHLFVLCQLEWPLYENLFHQLVDNIRKVKAFTYPLFMTYIIIPDILEEFTYLVTKQPQTELENSRMQLELLPPAPGLGSRSRTVTRGVNKGAKEDLRMAMEKQMGRAQEDISQLIISFLLNEGKLILAQ